MNINIPYLFYPKLANIEPQNQDKNCPECESNNRTLISGVVYAEDRSPVEFNLACGWCGKDWFVASSMILNNIIEDQMCRLWDFTHSTGKEFGALVLSTNRGMVLDMVQMGEDRSINLKTTRKLEEDEKLLGTFHVHPITDKPSYWDIATFLKDDWEKISCVAGVEKTITVMTKLKDTVALKEDDLVGWKEECVKKGKSLKNLSEKYKFAVYRGQPNQLKDINSNDSTELTLESLVF